MHYTFSRLAVVDDMFRSGAEGGKGVTSAQPSKRLQQTQAQVDEVHMS